MRESASSWIASSCVLDIRALSYVSYCIALRDDFQIALSAYVTPKVKVVEAVEMLNNMKGLLASARGFMNSF